MPYRRRPIRKYRRYRKRAWRKNYMTTKRVARIARAVNLRDTEIKVYHNYFTINPKTVV